MDKASESQQLGYGLVVLVVCLFYSIVLPFLFKRQLRNKGWTIAKEFVWILLIFSSLGTITYFYSAYILYGTLVFSFGEFAITLFNTTITAILPTIPILLYKKIFVYRRIIREVEKIDARVIDQSDQHFFYQSDGKISLESDNNDSPIDIYMNEFLYLAASGNYIEVYLEKDNTVSKKLIRNNISKVAKQFDNFEDAMRCHRSYIVNLKKVNNISGNLQGYQFYFKNTPNVVPVSRSNTKKVKEYFL